MTAPTAKLFIVPPSKTWTSTLIGVAASDILSPNDEDFTCEASGASGNQFNLVSGNMPATAVNAASAMNASSDVNDRITVYPTGPFSLDLATLANNDTLSLNGVQFKAKTSGADHSATPPEFNLASDHGAADLAAQINGTYGNHAGVAGTLGATASGTTVTLVGELTLWTPPSTVTHAVMSAADAVLTIKGSLTSFTATIASGSATLRAVCTPSQPFTCIVNITGGTSDDSVTNVEPNAKGTGAGADYLSATSISFDQGISQVNGSQPLVVPASSTDRFTQFGATGYSYQWDGQSFDYELSATLNFGAAGLITSDSALCALVNPSVT
jgi:hypothetical protein